MMQEPVSMTEHSDEATLPRSSSAALRAGVAMRTGEVEKQGFLARILGQGRRGNHARPEPCFIVAVLMLLDRSLALDGLVTGISPGAVMFRQAATFIFDRTGAEVSIRFGDHDRRGRITAVSPQGYLIELAEPLTGLQMAEVLRDYGQMAQ
jgi:hypothetical protein